MKSLLIRWVISALALYITALVAQMLNIGISVNGAATAFVAVLVLGIVNALIRPLLLLLTLPLNCLTLGLMTFVINGLMFWIASTMVSGFVVKGPFAAIFGSIMMSIISGLANHVVAQGE